MSETKESLVIEDNVKELKDVIVERGNPLSKKQKPLKKKSVIIDALKLVFDPEINIDVYNLGLIYDIDLQKDGNVNIVMSLTSPTCPMADEIPIWVAESVASLEGVGVVVVKVVWYPVWDLSKMSEDAKFQMEFSDLNFGFLGMDFNE